MTKKNVPATTPSLDDAVKEINSIYNKAQIQCAIEIGKYLLAEFFDNDINKALSKNPDKEISLRTISEHDSINIDYPNLSKMVRIADQEKEIADSCDGFAELTYSHKSELIKIKDSNKKIRLAIDCIKFKWSVRKLAEKVKAAKKPKKDSDKSKQSIAAANEFIKIINKAMKVPVIKVTNEDKGLLDELKQKKKDELLQKTKEMKKRFESMNAECEKLITKLEATKAN